MFFGERAIECGLSVIVSSVRHNASARQHPTVTMSVMVNSTCAVMLAKLSPASLHHVIGKLEQVFLGHTAFFVSPLSCNADGASETVR